MISDIDAFVIDELVEQYRSDPVTREDSLRSLASLVKNHAVLDHLKTEAADRESKRRDTLCAILRDLHVELPGEAPATATAGEPAGDDGSLPARLAAVLASTVPHTVKIEAIRKAMDGKDATCWPVIRDRIVEEDDEWVLATLLRAAGHLGDSFAVPVLTPFLRSPDARIVANAIEALEDLDPDHLTDLLLPMLLHGSRRVRAAAVVVLGRRRRPALMDRLTALAEDPQRGNRLRALECLSFVEGDDVDRLLVARLEEERDMSVLKGIAELASRQMTETAVPHLVARTRATTGARHSVLAYVATALASRYGLSLGELSPRHPIQGRGDGAPASERRGDGRHEARLLSSRRPELEDDAPPLPAPSADRLEEARAPRGSAETATGPSETRSPRDVSAHASSDELDLSSSRSVRPFAALRTADRRPSVAGTATPVLRPRTRTVPWKALVPLGALALLFLLKAGMDGRRRTPSPAVAREKGSASFSRLRDDALRRIEEARRRRSESTEGPAPAIEVNGTLRGVGERRLTLRADGMIYSVRLPATLQTASLHRGDRVTLRGTVRHWGYSGLVYLDGESLRKEAR